MSMAAMNPQRKSKRVVWKILKKRKITSFKKNKVKLESMTFLSKWLTKMKSSKNWALFLTLSLQIFLKYSLLKFLRKRKLQSTKVRLWLKRSCKCLKWKTKNKLSQNLLKLKVNLKSFLSIKLYRNIFTRCFIGWEWGRYLWHSFIGSYKNLKKNTSKLLNLQIYWMNSVLKLELKRQEF